MAEVVITVPGRSRRKVPDDVLAAAYAELKSVWAVARQVGMSGQQVHVRLAALGLTNPVNEFTDAEKARLVSEYNAAADAGKLGELAEAMGRTKAFICRQAKHLGLTDRKRKKAYLKDALSAKAKAWLACHEHPRGMLGKTHTPENRRKFADNMRNMPAEVREAGTLKSLKTRAKNGTLISTRPNQTWKAAWREIGGVRKYYRSRWEANYARYLQSLKDIGAILSWEHEPETFWFEEVRRGTRSYLPDFRVTDADGAVAYHEVKGWMDPASILKLERMRRYHPAVTVILIDAKTYRQLERRVAAATDGWEF
jgi:hypothetical protein